MERVQIQARVLGKKTEEALHIGGTKWTYMEGFTTQNSSSQEPPHQRGECGETRLHKPNPWVKKLQEEPRENLTWSQLGDNVPAKLEEKKKRGHIFSVHSTLQLQHVRK